MIFGSVTEQLIACLLYRIGKRHEINKAQNYHLEKTVEATERMDYF